MSVFLHESSNGSSDVYPKGFGTRREDTWVLTRRPQLATHLWARHGFVSLHFSFLT